MAVAFANANSNATGNFSGASGDVSVSPPVSLATGDLWLVIAGSDIDPGATITMPAGWTPVSSLIVPVLTYPACRAFWKIAGASEAAVNVSFGTGTYQCWAHSERYTGAHASAPIGNVNTVTPSGSVATLDAPDITIQNAGSMAVLVFMCHSLAAGATTITEPSGTATPIMTRSSAGQYAQGAITYQAQNAGSYAPGNWTTDSGRDGRLGLTFEIIPAGAGGGITSVQVDRGRGYARGLGRGLQ